MSVLARLRRVRSGETIALAGAILVAVALNLPWYERPGRASLDAWSTFGVAVVLLIVAAVAAVAVVVTTVGERTPAVPIATAVWCAWLGLAGIVAAVIRLLERPDQTTVVCAGAWVALGGSVAIFAGAWQTLRDERTGSYQPLEVPPRPPPEP